MDDIFDFDLEVTVEIQPEFKFEEIVEVTTSNHEQLINRDKPDQHPIKSITELENQLSRRLIAGQIISNEEIDEILKI